jgi:hypothetical protein
VNHGCTGPYATILCIHFHFYFALYVTGIYLLYPTTSLCLYLCSTLPCIAYTSTGTYCLRPHAIGAGSGSFGRSVGACVGGGEVDTALRGDSDGDGRHCLGIRPLFRTWHGRPMPPLVTRRRGRIESGSTPWRAALSCILRSALCVCPHTAVAISTTSPQAQFGSLDCPLHIRHLLKALCAERLAVPGKEEVVCKWQCAVLDACQLRALN